MITLHAEASALTVTEGLDDTMLVAGMANVASVRVTFSEDWTGLGKMLLFYNGETTIRHLMLSDDEIVPIPHEVLAVPGRTLYVGVQGTDGEQVILPTVRCKLKAILASIDPDGDETVIPDPPQWEQMREDMAELAAEATAAAETIHTDAAAVREDKEDAEAAAASAAVDAASASADALAAAQVAASIPEDYSALSELTHDAYPQRTISGAAQVYMDDAGDQLPLQALTLGLDWIQPGSGDPAPDNVRPVYGLGGVKIKVTGKNIFDQAALLTAPEGWALDETTAYYTGTAAALAALYGAETDGFFGKRLGWTGPLTVAVSFTLARTEGLSAGQIVAEYRDGTTSALSLAHASGDKADAVRVSAVFGSRGAIIDRVYYAPGTEETIRVKDVQAEFYRTDTYFKSYRGLPDVEITFPETPGTVYAGTLDAVTGTLTVTHIRRVFTGSENWTYNDAAIRRYFYISVSGSGANAPIENNYHARKSTGACTHYKLLTDIPEFGTAYDMAIVYSHYPLSSSTTTRPIAIRDSRYTDADTFKAYLAAQYAADTPVELVYRLATPKVYQLTPAQVPLMRGVNIVRADGTELSLDYAADPVLQHRYVTPQMYGAVADGAHDDTAAVQAAVKSGYDVYFPTSHREIYLITDTITFSNKYTKKIYGDGIWRGGGTTGGYILFDATRGGLTLDQMREKPLLAISSDQMVHIYGLTFQCRTWSETDSRIGVCIDATTTLADKDIRIDHCDFVSFYRCFKIRGRGFELQNSSLASINYGGTFDWDDANESNSNNNPSYGQRAITFKSNRFHSITSGLFRFASGHAYGMTMIGNTMDHGKGYVLTAAQEAWNWVISGNVFDALTGEGTAALDFAGGAWKCSITGNVISGDRAYWRTEQPLPVRGIRMGAAMRKCTLTGNVINGVQRYNIELAAVTGSVISGNTLSEAGNVTGDPAAAGIRISGNSSDTTISGNSFTPPENDGAINPNAHFLSSAEGVRLDRSVIWGNAYGPTDPGLGSLIAASTDLLTDVVMAPAVAQLQTDTAQLKTATADVITDEASGNPAVFPDGADGRPVRALTVTMEPVQAGSGEPAPDNIRTITGRTGAAITVSPTQDAADGTTYAISWADEAGTVYMGTLDAVTGLLTVTHIRIAFMGSKTTETRWVKSSTGGRPAFYSPILTNVIAASTNAKNSTGACSHYNLLANKAISIFQTRDNVIIYCHGGIGSQKRAWIRDERFLNGTKEADEEAFNDYLAAQYDNGTPVELVYRLATPQTHQLTAPQILTLLGENHISSDADSVSVIYAADTKLYIAKILAEQEG